MFESIPPAPIDPILGLTEAFKADPHPQRINLGVGIYQDDHGQTPLLETVKQAAQLVLASNAGAAYLPIPGVAEYRSAIQQLMFGSEHEAITSARAWTAQTPGGTGALRVTADFLHQNLPHCTVWLTTPTWANHPNIFAAAGVPTNKVPYFDAAHNRLAIDELLTAIQQIPAGDAILLHGCCHNPTGVDPTAHEWEQLAEALYAQGVLPIIDFAYQGFADGIEQDAAGLLAMTRPGKELVVCSSYSKNFGLYSHRTGAVTFVAATADQTAAIESQLKHTIRANYSNPPAWGAQLVATILNDAALRSQWEGEVTQMRDRINGMRQLLVTKLAEQGVPGDYSFIQAQRGMFSFTGLSKQQVLALREKHAIYIVDSGRINVAGITKANIDRLTAAIADVMS